MSRFRILLLAVFCFLLFLSISLHFYNVEFIVVPAIARPSAKDGILLDGMLYLFLPS